MKRFLASLLVAGALAAGLVASASAATGDSADLGVAVSADKTSVKVGDLVTYTVVVRNHGESAAQEVTLTNLLPTGLELVSATVDKNGSSDGTSVTSSSLPAGALAVSDVDPTSDTSQAARIVEGAALDLGTTVDAGSGRTLVTASLGWLGSETYWSEADSTATVTIVAKATASGTLADVASVSSTTNPDPNVAANNYAQATVSAAA